MKNGLSLAPILAAAALCLSPMACYNLPWFNQDTGDDTAPEAEKNAFHEGEFAEDPSLAAELHHIVMLQPELTGTHEGDTGSEEGVDVIPYEIKSTTRLGVALNYAEGRNHRIELCDSDGNVITFAGATEAAASQTLSPGRYHVKVYHDGVGAVGGQFPLVFLRTVSTSGSSGTQRRLTGIDPLQTALDPIGSCHSCRLYNPFGAYDPYGPPDAYDPDANIFCRQGDVGMSPHYYDPAIFVSGDVSCGFFWGTDFTCYGRYTPIIFFGEDCRSATFTNCNFQRVTMSGTIRDSRFVNCNMQNVNWRDFSLTGNSTLSNCDLRNGVSLHGVTLAGITIDGCNFSGAAFTHDGSSPATSFQGSTVHNCNFDGATFAEANFSNVRTLFQDSARNSFGSARLAGVDLTGVDLVGINMASSNADWSNVNFTNADLDGCDLSSLTLTGSNFTGASLKQAILKNHAHLTGCTFTGANLTSADFSGATVTGLVFDGATATSANFAGANMDRISAHGALYAYANLSDASMAGAQVGAASGSGLRPAVMSFAYMPNVRMTHSADCRNVDFSYAHMYGDRASVEGSDLSSANFTNAVVSGMNFSGATLESTNFDNAQAINTRFVGARLTNAKFDSAYLQGADFTGAFATSVIFANAAVSTAGCGNNTATCSRCSTSDCHFSDLDQGNLCCYSFSEEDGSVYAVAFGATVLPTDTTIICPDGSFGPCTGDKLKAKSRGPYPPVPACVPSALNWCDAPTD